MKPGDLVRFRDSALRDNHTSWLKDCARNKTPILVLKEYISGSSLIPPIEVSLLGERVFEVMCEEVNFHAFECELIKIGDKH